MAYFLKKSKLKRGMYLQIYESFRDTRKKETAHRSIKSLGYVEDLIAEGIADPVAYFTSEVKAMNEKAKSEKERLKREEISDNSNKNVGHFLLNGFFNRFNLEQEFKFLTLREGFKFDAYTLLKGLVFARVIEPCSKHKTNVEVLPSLFGNYSFSDHELYRGLDFLGQEHESIIELLNYRYAKQYKRNTENVYFDATNFYFEIDSEDELRKKGPSKENRRDPLIGMGLLLDGDQVPLAAKFFPGNESEKPVIREVISEMKKRHHITGKIVQVADKGLNSTKNIVEALKNGDGYLYSQSVKMLNDVEENWVLNDNDYKSVYDEHGKELYRYKVWTDDFPYFIENDRGKKSKILLKQKRMVTFNPSLAIKQRAEINKMVEKVRLLSLGGAKKMEYGDGSKYVTFTSVDREGVVGEEAEIISVLREDKIKRDLNLAGYNMLITSETKLSAKTMYDTYHHLWRIEESFRILKSKLQARPVYVQTRNAIYGHFLINYIALFILRVLQIKIFEDKIHTNQIIEFCRNFEVTKYKYDYFNLGSKSIIEPFSKILNLDLLPRVLKGGYIKKLFDYKI